MSHIFKKRWQRYFQKVCIDASAKRYKWEQSPETIISEIEQKIGYPCIVKPVNMGSSIGVSKDKKIQELAEAITKAEHYDSKVLIERFVNKRYQDRKRSSTN